MKHEQFLDDLLKRIKDESQYKWATSDFNNVFITSSPTTSNIQYATVSTDSGTISTSTDGTTWTVR